MTMKTALSQALGASLYGPDPTAQQLGKQKIKALLERAIQLVDADLLGCIILTELEDVEGTRVRMTPLGDPRLVLQTASQIIRQSKAAAPPTG